MRRAWLWLAMVGCTGEITTPDFVPPDGPPPVDCVAPIADRPLQRLSTSELRVTLTRLFGAETLEPVQAQLAGVPSETEPVVGESHHEEERVAAMLDVTEALAEVLAAPGAMAAFGAPCLEEESFSDDCVGAFLAEHGPRILRRRITSEEASGWVAFTRDASLDRYERVLRFWMVLLNQPSLQFHLELEGDDLGSDLALSNHAIANRLAFAFTGGGPTGAITDALTDAEDGGMSLRARLEAPERRRALLGSIWSMDETRAHVVDVLGRWLEVENTPTFDSTALARASLDETLDLRALAQEDFRDFVGHVVFDLDGDFRTLMTEPSLHDSPVAESGDRHGILTRPALMLRDANVTGPILRGVFVQQRVLCDELPSPDADVVAARQEDVGSLDPHAHTSREVIEAITHAEACQSCHARINPPAFALEAFDEFGRRRTHEVIMNPEGGVEAEHALDLEVSISLDGDRRTLDGPDELAFALADSSQAARCFLQAVVETSRGLELRPADACQIQQLEQAVRDDVPIRELWWDAVASPTAARRALPTEETP